MCQLVMVMLWGTAIACSTQREMGKPKFNNINFISDGEITRIIIVFHTLNATCICLPHRATALY